MSHVVYDERRAHLELYVWPALRKFYDDNGHLRVPQNDPTCGEVVHKIRNRGDFLQHADFKAWLDERHFVYDEPRARTVAV